MVFEVGETVVYPHHGAARIEEIKMRTIKGEEKMYLKLKVAQGDLTIEVPAENVDLVGVRDVVDAEGLEHVMEVLRAEHVEEPTNWSRRYKANLEKLASGDVNKVAEVVRDLWRRDQDRGLSAGEKRMLAKARQVLVSELALAKKVTEEEAEGRLDKVLEDLVVDVRHVPHRGDAQPGGLEPADEDVEHDRAAHMAHVRHWTRCSRADEQHTTGEGPASTTRAPPLSRPRPRPSPPWGSRATDPGALPRMRPCPPPS